MQLIKIASRAYIVCYRENTALLKNSLKQEGFEVIESRQADKIGDTTSFSINCLLNHKSVWSEVSLGNSGVIVVEADFVPAIGMAKLTVPFPPELSQESFGYLYGCGIEVYDLINNKYMRGHSGATVAYYLCPKAAQILCKYSDTLLKRHSAESYSTWDTEIRYFMQNYGVNSYIPFHNFGEHGGLPNPEHSARGLNGTHRADRLSARLHFLPLYAKGSRFRFYLERSMAWFWGVGRLVCGRMSTKESFQNQSSKAKFVWQLFKRLVY